MAIIRPPSYYKPTKRELVLPAPVPRGTLSSREAHNRMISGGTLKPLVLLKGIVDNEVTIVTPKKYTVPAGTECLFAKHTDFPNHIVNLNYMVEDGYTCLADAKDCSDIIVNILPGFENEQVQVIYKNPLLNSQAAKKVLETWDSE
jgi:hypothetical protein